jgi:hypothetical protein
MLWDVKLKMWQSVLIAFVVSGILFQIVVFLLLPGGDTTVLVQVTP